ncbi:hypothetical protein DPMN_136272 [Dreissena polymorpha]|uniref:Uncharacterized protein n=1 Tax=Dreissena polymorpha TaxID=45954 RepID=A0A9D4FZE1_DREPO|nr:hypothetical protein DPMN_136272 [Dreissena polymorpha]
MKKEIKGLVTYVTAMNQQEISFEKRGVSELATFSQHLVDVQERLDNIDSQVYDESNSQTLITS